MIKDVCLSITTEDVKAELREHVQSEKGLKRAVALKEAVAKADLSAVMRKLRADDCTGQRWKKSLTSYSELVVETRKICAVVPEQKLSANSAFQECKEKLLSFQSKVQNLVRSKFVDELVKVR